MCLYVVARVDGVQKNGDYMESLFQECQFVLYEPLFSVRFNVT